MLKALRDQSMGGGGARYFTSRVWVAMGWWRWCGGSRGGGGGVARPRARGRGWVELVYSDGVSNEQCRWVWAGAILLLGCGWSWVCVCVCVCVFVCVWRICSNAGGAGGGGVVHVGGKSMQQWQRKLLISLELCACRMDSTAQEEINYFDESETDPRKAGATIVRAANARRNAHVHLDSDGEEGGTRWFPAIGDSVSGPERNNTARRCGGAAMRIAHGPHVCPELRVPILCTLEKTPPAIIRHGHKVTREAEIRKNAYKHAKQTFAFQGPSAAPKNNARVRMIAVDKKWAREEQVLCLNVFIDARV